MNKQPVPAPWQRPEFEREPADASQASNIRRPLSATERLFGNEAVRKTLILIVLIVIWEVYARWLDNPLLFPSFSDMIRAFWTDFANGVLPNRLATSMKTLLMGYGIGLLIAAIFTTLAVSTRLGTDLLTTLTSMFNPLPSIALLPLSLIWFGLGQGALVFVIVHSVLWAVSLNSLVGFRGVPETLRMSGRNCGLGGLRYVALLLVPAAFPAILAGLKIGWAFAWRTLIAAELIFGVASGSGSLGWYIFESRAELETPSVFAGLFVVIIIGLLVESIVFRTIEKYTIQRWGMER